MVVGSEEGISFSEWSGKASLSSHLNKLNRREKHALHHLGKSALHRGDDQCKSPEVGACLKEDQSDYCN